MSNRLHKSTTFAGVLADKKEPTKRHRPAIWENMLGTVYAMNSAGEIRYFDYDHEAAHSFAGITEGSDPRVAKKRQNVRYGNGAHGYTEPIKGQWVLWILKEEN